MPFSKFCFAPSDNRYIFCRYWLISFFLVVLISEEANSQNVPKDEFVFEAIPASDWTRLMERTSGWFGADGIFSIPLDGAEIQEDTQKETLLIFSDTFVGEVINKIPLSGAAMVNNSMARLKGIKPTPSSIDFDYNTDRQGTPISFFQPDNTNAQPNEYFWLGDGFINHEKQGALYIFAYHVHKTGENVFDFEQTNVALLKMKNATPKGIKEYTQIATDLGFVHPTEGRVYFGSGIFVNTKSAGAPNPDGYVYVYGIMERQKSLIVARVLPSNFEEIDKWQFWNGLAWDPQKENVVSILNGISNELSVSPSGEGRYFLTCTILGLSDKIGISVGYSPVGPFGELNEVYTCPEFKEKGLFTYNAKAHYHLSKPGELLVSYNTITLDFWNDIKKDATIYHPRFVWIRYK